MKQHRSVPVVKGNTYTIDILRLGSSGEGVGRYENFTVFVRGALPGETVQAKVDVVKKQYATAILQDIVMPSPQRVAPLCPVYAQCGGCQLQHMSYDGELLEKQGQGDKFTAVNKMLQNFAEFDKQPWQTKMSLAANLISMDSFEMLQTTSLQKEGKSFLANQNKVQNFLYFNKSTER